MAVCVCEQYGLQLSEDEWSSEWKSLVKLSSPQPRNVNTNQSLSYVGLTL